MSPFTSLFRDLKRNWLYASLLSILLGIVLLIFPGTAILTVGYLIGALFILVGVTRIVAYVRGNALFYSGGLLLGLSALLLGVLIIARADVFAGFLPFVIGIVTVFTGAAGIQGALESRREGYGGWGYSMFASVLSIVIGVLLIVNPFASMLVTVMFIGASLIVDGVCDLIAAWSFGRKIK